jgi:hypothetical protein
MSINLTGEFFPAYRAANPNFSNETFDCAKRTVTRLLDTATTSEQPGMLLGKVQSGKTRTFISILALAFDNGYDIAVIFSKNSKALIEQTHKRLRAEFSEFVESGDMDIYDIMNCPGSFTAFELESKLIFVVKKQADNLVKLEALFTEKCPAMKSKRVLIIDDEADNASIGYSRKAGVIEANKIARQISDFRAKLDQSSFLQVTATPYSLYLQPSVVEVGNVAEFKPTRPAFTELVPVPAAYVGGDTYFGPAAHGETETVESLIHHNVNPAEFERLKKMDKRSFKPDEILSSHLYEGIRHAIITFITGGCIQRLNGAAKGENTKKLRYSFLIHSEAAKGAHMWQADFVEELVKRFLAASQSDQVIFRDLVEASYLDLSRSLALAEQPIPTLDAVLDEVKTALAGEYVTIAKVNSDEDVAALLDESGQLKLRSPLCFFIGGQVLDRGVTLANLIGFYYGRRPNKFQQDTVLQHSRMYGYRRADLPVTRFYTSAGIRHAMAQMEEFDSALRSAIEAGGDRAVQFIQKAKDGRIIPCSPNKILVATTQALRPHKRLVPIGFQTGHKTGKNAIGKAVEELDEVVMQLCGFTADEPTLITLDQALDLLNRIQPTLLFEDDDAPPFDWDAARAALCHLCQQHPDASQRNKVLLWAAKDRNSARKSSSTSHTFGGYIETPDSTKTEGQIAMNFAIDHPIFFLLRQNGSKEKGWNDTPFYWPVIRAQANAPTAIYTAETVELND